MSYRADVHHDPLGSATDIKPWPWKPGKAVHHTLTTEDRMTAKKAARKSRIITAAEKRVKSVALGLRQSADALDLLAEELHQTDARETRPDPSSRNARRRVKKL
jgi:hypothetical protein